MRLSIHNHNFVPEDCHKTVKFLWSASRYCGAVSLCPPSGVVLGRQQNGRIAVVLRQAFISVFTVFRPERSRSEVAGAGAFGP